MPNSSVGRLGSASTAKNPRSRVSIEPTNPFDQAAEEERFAACSAPRRSLLSIAMLATTAADARRVSPARSLT